MPINAPLTASAAADLRAPPWAAAVRDAVRDVAELERLLELSPGALDALARGLPDSAGVAVGVDRLVALALGAEGVADAMAFVHGPPRG